LRHGTTHLVNISAAAVDSPTLNSDAVRVVSNVDCHVAFGAGAASVGSAFLPANVVEDYPVRNGADIISVIRDSTDGYLYVTELS